MKITKYEHACVTVEDQGVKLVIDPGILSESYQSSDAIAGIVITHQHPDHLDPAKIQQIIADNPDVKIFSTQDAADTHTDLTIHIVHANDIQQVGPFALKFFGDDHAVIHSRTPVVQNVGVLVNDAFYYPGDSFTLPHHDITVLAVPAAAPWMKIQEAMDYIAAVKPRQVIPTHDAVLSAAGQSFHDMWLKQASEQNGSTYQRLATGESLTI